MMQFVIHHKITSKDSTNRVYSGLHYRTRMKIADYWHNLVRAEIMSQLPKRKPFDVPVIIEFRFRSKLDISNHSFLVKMIEDALKGVLIHDDTQKYVKGIVMMACKDDDEEGDIIVTIREFN